MAKQKKGKPGFMLYHAMRDPLAAMTDEQRGKLVLYALDYSENGCLPKTEDGWILGLFSVLRHSIDEDSESYRQTCAQNAENGRKGAAITNARTNAQSNAANADERQRAPTSADKTEQTAANPANWNRNCNRNRKNKSFIPPSSDDVRSFAAENGLQIDAERFVDFYKSKGWKVGSSPMKDWKAAARNWSRENSKNNTHTQARNMVHTEAEYGGWG